MIGTTKRRKILFGALTLALCCTLTLGMTSEAPLILYPITPSLPPGLYIRTFELPKVDMIAAFRVPKEAKRYKESIGEYVNDDFLFMKPIIAGPGDHVCHHRSDGLFVDGKWFAHISAHDAKGRELPIWKHCRLLTAAEYLVASRYSQMSLDSRHFGPVTGSTILATYRRLVGSDEASNW